MYPSGLDLFQDALAQRDMLGFLVTAGMLWFFCALGVLGASRC